jgi:O-antigen/teichoic acid export membrane protein
MIFYLRGMFSKIGIDKSILFTSTTNILSSFGSLLSIFLIVRYLSLGEQGFFYTFSSLLAIQVFFEMGLNGIIVQFVAHEVSHLSWSSSERLSGDKMYLSRLASLLRFSIYWYLAFSTLLLVILIGVGFYFFNSFSDESLNVVWRSPWILLVFGTVFNLMISPFLAFIQGLGKITEIAKLQFLQLIFRLITLWLGLIFGLKLFVLGMSAIISLLPVVYFYFFKFKKLLKNIWNSEILHRLSYKKEIFPFQWKIAISWISGYFIFQLFNPVLFATAGPKIAGQMGITITALNGILALSTSWISTKIPIFSNLIALNKIQELNLLFNRAIKQSAIVNFFGLTLFICILIICDITRVNLNGVNLRDRFLEYLPMLFMMLPVFINNIVYGLATYLRCHKKEPLMFVSISTAILNSLSIYFLTKRFGVNGISLGYCIIVCLLFPWTYFIYMKHKKMRFIPNNNSLLT